MQSDATGTGGAALRLFKAQSPAAQQIVQVHDAFEMRVVCADQQGRNLAALHEYKRLKSL